MHLFKVIVLYMYEMWVIRACRLRRFWTGTAKKAGFLDI